MVVYHIVLFKLKDGVTQDQVDEMTIAAKGMVGQIPGLIKLDANPPIASTASRAKGYNMGIVAILERPDDLPGYAGHPAHLKVHQLREALCDDTLAYDMEF